MQPHLARELIDTLESINTKLGVLANATIQISKALQDDSSLDYVKDMNKSFKEIASNTQDISMGLNS
tara:strand:- start:57 stop:257 length:201 start_codon:yes stop_codon:yes gene_type:complete